MIQNTIFFSTISAALLLASSFFVVDMAKSTTLGVPCVDDSGVSTIGDPCNTTRCKDLFAMGRILEVVTDVTIVEPGAGAAVGSSLVVTRGRTLVVATAGGGGGIIPGNGNIGTIPGMDMGIGIGAGIIPPHIGGAVTM